MNVLPSFHQDGLVYRALGDMLHLTKLPPFFNYGIVSFVFFLAIHQIAAPLMTSIYMPEYWQKMSKRAKNNWCIHVVSQVHVIIIVPMALRCLANPDLNVDRAFGWSDQAGAVHIIACGYFLWDTIDAIINFVDFGFVLHGACCVLIYTLSFRPFLAYYGVRCLLWESSTFFLNIHWWMDKTGRTGTRFQMINGCLLLATFFSVRIVYGGIISYDFFKTLYRIRNEAPLGLTIGYGAGNILLQCLNYFWFAKMILALKKRMAPKILLVDEDVGTSGEIAQNVPASEQEHYHD